MAVEKSKFLDDVLAVRIAEAHETPVYVYSERILRQQALSALSFPNSFGLTVRFAMKACPNAAVLQLFHSLGIHFDASSGFEVKRAIKAGIPPDHISLSSQELPRDFADLIRTGIHFNACSLKQLKAFGDLFPGGSCGVRFNPGLGSGGTGKTNVGGPAASFGVWHEQRELIKAEALRAGVRIVKIHTHIGSGSDPAVWQGVAGLSLGLVRDFPDVTVLNLGGGFKVGRMSYEKSTDLQVIGATVRLEMENFAAETGRQLRLEIEPGTYLVANAGALLSTVQDIVSTESSQGPGFKFLKLDAGMTDVLRPSLYGAQHPIVVHKPSRESEGEEVAVDSYVVVGHCCESGDLFTCAPGEAEVLAPRLLHTASIGDLISIEGAGAYCSSMSTKNYNSFPEAAEVLLDQENNIHLIRRRQTLEQIIENELPYAGV